MIRRDAGGEYLLFAQHDHALLAGRLARHFGGNEAFARPARGATTVVGVEQHDAGWPLHDDAPTRSAGGQPLDVFEVPRAIALPVWTASAERAEAVDPYAGLLVSLHSLSLSVYATTRAPAKHEAFDVSDLRERFEVNKFQHREIERQERLRKRLGLRLDLPLTHGLAAANADPVEDALAFDFRLLQAMDQISLGLCCTEPPMQKTTVVHHAVGGRTSHLRVRRDGPFIVRVTPWPFDVPRIAVTVPARRVRGGTYDNDDALRGEYARAPRVDVEMVVARDGE